MEDDMGHMNRDMILNRMLSFAFANSGFGSKCVRCGALLGIGIVEAVCNLSLMFDFDCPAIGDDSSNEGEPSTPELPSLSSSILEGIDSLPSVGPRGGAVLPRNGPIARHGTEHMKFLTQCRKVKAKDARQAIKDAKLAVIEEVWNSQVVRVGDQLGDRVEGDSHANKFTSAGVARQAWGSVGTLSLKILTQEKYKKLRQAKHHWSIVTLKSIVVGTKSYNFRSVCHSMSLYVCLLTCMCVRILKGKMSEFPTTGS